MNSQSEFDCVEYKHHCEFTVHKKITTMLTCPYWMGWYPYCICKGHWHFKTNLKPLASQNRILLYAIANFNGLQQFAKL